MKTKRIESRDNPLLKLVRKVRDGHDRDRIFVEGVRLAEEAIRSGIAVESCLYNIGFAETERKADLLRLAEHAGASLAELSTRLLGSIAETKNSQGIILICKRPSTSNRLFKIDSESDSKRMPLYVLLSEVNDPSNVGAVVRTAEAAGAAGVLISENSADGFSPRALRASMGSAFRLPVWEDVPIESTIKSARTEGFQIAATARDGDASYLDIDWKQPLLVIFGSEGHGLSREILDYADMMVNIPIVESVESLNLAVSVGVILFEARRQNRLT